MALECDFLIPAALGSAINESNVDSLDCKVIIEAANGPVTGEAANKLWKQKISIIPDILTNSRGSSKMTVLLGYGNRSFRKLPHVQTGSYL